MGKPWINITQSRQYNKFTEDIVARLKKTNK